jgi:hypothetical protein
MIRIRDLRDDFYAFDEDNYCLRGRKYGKVLSLGDTVRIEVKRADLVKKQLDFAFVEQSEATKRTSMETSNKRERERTAPKKIFKDQMKSATEKNTEVIKEDAPKTEKKELKKPLTPGKKIDDEWGFEI